MLAEKQITERRTKKTGGEIFRNELYAQSEIFFQKIITIENKTNLPRLLKLIGEVLHSENQLRENYKKTENILEPSQLETDNAEENRIKFNIKITENEIMELIPKKYDLIRKIYENILNSFCSIGTTDREEFLHHWDEQTKIKFVK